MTKRTALDSIRAVSRNSSDGYMDEVHPLRDRVGADLVHLVVSDGDDYCGTALELGAFGLTRFGCGALLSRMSWGTTWGSGTIDTRSTTVKAACRRIQRTVT